MNDLPKRPISIIIAQVIVLLLGLLWTVFGLLWLLSAFVGPQGSSVLTVLFVASVLLVFGVTFLICFWGLCKRKKYGWWIASMGLSLIFLSGLVNTVTGTGQYYKYENSAQMLGGMFASLVLYGLFGWLIARLIFGEPTRNFFMQPSTEERFNEPPAIADYDKSLVSNSLETENESE